MKKSNLFCAFLLVVSIGACEAEEEAAPAPLLPLPTEPDASPDASEGDVVAVDVSDTTSVDDTVTGDDTVTADATTDVDEDQASVSDSVGDTAEDATCVEREGARGRERTARSAASS